MLNTFEQIKEAAFIDELEKIAAKVRFPMPKRGKLPRVATPSMRRGAPITRGEAWQPPARAQSYATPKGNPMSYGEAW